MMSFYNKTTLLSFLVLSLRVLETSGSQQEGLGEEMGERGLFVTCTVALDMICVLSKISIYLSVKRGPMTL